MENKHNNIHEALSSIIGEIQDPALDSTNPHFKSKYASLPAVLQVIRPVVAKHGLSFVQIIEDNKLVTKLTHPNGGEIVSSVNLPTGGTMQALGSSITYARRYSLTAMFGICGDEDDDGNSATTKLPQQVPTINQIKKILASKGITTTEEALSYLSDLGFKIQNFNLPEKILKEILTKIQNA